MSKWLVHIDQDDVEDIEIEPDDPTYDGPESNIEDPYGYYHIEADTEEEAIKAARWLDSIGDDIYFRDNEEEMNPIE